MTVVVALKNGQGHRALTPSGQGLAGKPATGALLGAVPGDRMPVILAESSRGSMASDWAMVPNFDRACDYDLPDKPCHPAVGLRNIKGVMRLSDFSAGPGYVTRYTDKADQGRALFMGRSLYDYAESLAGAIDAYDRVTGLKELVVVRWPHPLEV